MNHTLALAVTTVLCVAIGNLGAAGAEAPGRELSVWTVDPLVNVLPEDTAETHRDLPGATAEVARGEHATWQVAVRAEAPLREVRASCDPLKPVGRGGKGLARPMVRFVGFVPVVKALPNPPKDRLRREPALYPDPLLEEKAVSVRAFEAQPVWATLPIPAGAAPGEYRTTLRIAARSDTARLSAEVPLALTIYDVTAGPSRLQVVNWFNTGARHFPQFADPKSPAYWDLLRKIARNMAEHRQNVVRIITLDVVKFSPGRDGGIAMDWSDWERWVRIFREEGVIGSIAGGHLGRRTGKWEEPFGAYIWTVEDGKAVQKVVDPKSAEAERFYAQFLPELSRRLKEQGLERSFMQHIADEPVARNIESYRAIAALVRKYAPEMRIIDATLSREVAGTVDVWVPLLDALHKEFAFYKERQAKGEELWYYTCLFPQGEYANRFLETPLIRTRLLHWINARYGVTGYLHWGYNFYGPESPYVRADRSTGDGLPAGDAWIVYPGADGPLDSIRWEAMRDGIADHELLSMLAERDPREARRLVERHILDFNRYDTSVAAFRATRRELLEALSSARPAESNG